MNKSTCRSFLLSVFFLMLGLHALGQELERLDKELKQAQTSDARFYALVNLSDFWSYQDTSKALDYLDQAQKLTGSDPLLQAVYLFYYAGVFYGLDNKKSQAYYLKAEDYFKKIESPESYRYRARLWHNYGALEQLAGNDKAFLDITLTKCIPFILKAADNNLLMSYFTDVGMVFNNHKEYHKALEYYQKAISLVHGPEDETENLLWTYLNMFDVYYAQRDKIEAGKLLEKAEVLLNKLPEKKLAGVFYKLQAKFLSSEKRYKEALESVSVGMKMAERYHLDWDYKSLQYEKTQIYRLMGDWPSAKKTLEDLLQATSTSSLTKSRLTMINELAEIEAKLGNYQQAFAWTQSYKNLHDSLGNLDFKQQLADLETQYRTKEKEQEIVLLESKNLLNRAILIVVMIFVLLLGLGLFYVWKVRKNRTRAEAYLKQQRQELELSKALVEGEEQERKRLARELHDGLIGRVTGLKMQVEGIFRDPKISDGLPVITALQTVISELRQTAHNLEPTVLKNQGLEAAIKHYCRLMDSSQTKVSCYLSGLNKIEDKHLKLSIFRIVQELVTNAVKHAQATTIHLQCSLDEQLLLIEIEDNGVGFDQKTTNRNMGLNNLESRVRAINGLLKIESLAGEGTHFIIEANIKQ